MGKTIKGTIAIDSAGELARLFFAKDMGKAASTLETIRQVNNYPGTTERLNMLVRRAKNFRDQGWEIVFTAHEDIQKVYAKGTGIAAKGQTANEPIAVKGWPDLPGNRTPDEFCRAADNVFRMRYVSGKPQWVLKREPMGGGGDYWEVKDRFNAPAINAGYVDPDYRVLSDLASKCSSCHWDPPYIWVFYGSFGIGKTRSLRTFPQPIKLFDLDRGSTSLTPKEVEESRITIINNIDVEASSDYAEFIKQWEAAPLA